MMKKWRLYSNLWVRMPHHGCDVRGIISLFDIFFGEVIPLRVAAVPGYMVHVSWSHLSKNMKDFCTCSLLYFFKLNNFHNI